MSSLTQHPPRTLAQPLNPLTPWGFAPNPRLTKQAGEVKTVTLNGCLIKMRLIEGQWVNFVVQQ